MDIYQEHVSPDAAKNIEAWLTEPKYAEYKTELEQMITDQRWKDLEDAFFKVIEFGTAGRRGATGIGSNRINRVTIGESTQALCQYAIQADSGASQKGIVIACDTRLSSPELSKYAACVAAANGFKTYIFESYRSTPELSFAIRELGCAIGVVISASHNPPIDNGFKAYWSDGAQLVSPHDKGVLSVAAEIGVIHALPSYDEALKNSEIIEIGSEVDEKYIAAAAAEAEGGNHDVTIAYSPLHGAGQRNTLPVLKAVGFKHILTVDDQMVPDGNFPTIESGKPNPEEKAANDRVVALMLASDADIAISNDPDADRIGVIVRQDDKPIYLSGNQVAVLAAEFVLQKLQQKAQLTPQHYIAKTIVSTDMLDAIAENYSIRCYGNLLIGFKYIGELIRNREPLGDTFVMGAEESFGMLKGSYARDKDGATGALPIAEYAAELKATGKTLWDRLLELYQKYGLYIERIDTMVCPGADGFSQMQQIMTSLRETPPTQIDDHQVTAVLDYQSRLRTDLTTGVQTEIDCISGNVIVLECGDPRRRITVRPSGTEPKLKFYVQWFEKSDNVVVDYDAISQELENTSRELEGIAFARVGR